MHTHGAVYWTELMTRDLDKARTYYQSVCGWSFEAMPMETGTYHVGRLNGEMVIGMFDIAEMEGMEGIPAHWMTYFAVNDVDAAVRATEAAGGSVQRAPWDVPGIGRIAIVTDPGGAVLGLMRPSEAEPMAG
jgi:predicted enzyme related to lactoylglutathione lyase